MTKRTFFANSANPVDAVPHAGPAPNPYDSAHAVAAITAAYASVVTDIATLVSDAGSPTQGHVNTLNTDWGVFKTALDAAIAAAATAAKAFDVGLLVQCDDVKIPPSYPIDVTRLVALTRGNS